MPLVRLQVRNEFGLGQPELYRESNREDPKAVLDGVAVAGLVGILRQLGDLAEYVFFDIIFVFFFFFFVFVLKEVIFFFYAFVQLDLGCSLDNHSNPFSL